MTASWLRWTTVRRCVVLWLILLPVSISRGQENAADSDRQQRQLAERFLQILEKNPRRGVALDRVYGHHVEFGTLDQFVDELQQRTRDNSEDVSAWMILGLVQAQRGQDLEAVLAFTEAEQRSQDNALAPYYRGQSLLLIGQPEQAVQAFELAIERQPDRADLLEIFQQLGRVHQRAQHTEQALEVWTRLESLFPDDPRVLEQIASILVDEGGYQQALPRFERLLTLVRDDYRKSTVRMSIADLKFKLNRRSEGITDLEALLGDLNPDGWLYRDVRRRIEEVFLRSGDQDGLVTYYQSWLKSHPDDVGGMVRLARFLASSARVPEAMQWMDKALTLAPSRTELRRAFIDQLADSQRYAEAAQQFEMLDKASPGDPDVLRDWGKTVLKNRERSPEERQAEATAIWNRIVEQRPTDALTAAQVADLFRQANLSDRALELYQQAVTLAPDDPQYREYLGEFYHIRKETEKALETWQAIAAPPRHDAIHLARQAEVLHTFGYLPGATSAIGQAAHLDQKDFNIQLQAAKYFTQAGKHEDALGFVETARRLAASDDEREGVLKQHIETLQAAQLLDDEIEQLSTRLAAASDSTSEDWHLLARYFESERKWAEASDAIQKALSRDARSLPALTTAARIAEISGNLGEAAELCRRLAEVDRRGRGDHLESVARLETQLGHTDRALQAGQDLIVSAPGNTEHYEFYAQLCLQLGRPDEALETLRKAVRINPTEPRLLMTLASALAGQFRASEAIQMYWQAFEKSESLDDFLNLTIKLTDLHLQLNQFEKLIERLERERREEDQRRLMTICIAQAQQAAGDLGGARTELESLLSQETRDTELLQQLSKLCEQEQDRQAAISYQRQLVSIAPAHETEFRLAQLLQANGESEEASDIFQRLTRREEDPERLLRNLDALLNSQSFDAVISITEPLLRERRDDWELLYREGFAYGSQEKWPEAERCFRQLLAINVSFETPGVRAARQLKQAQARSRSNNRQGVMTAQTQGLSSTTAATYAYTAKRSAGLVFEEVFFGSGRSSHWTPDYYSVARVASWAWLLRIARERGQEEEFARDLQEQVQQTTVSREALLDWLYVCSLKDQQYPNLEILNIARRLAQQGGVDEQNFFLSQVGTRHPRDPNASRGANSAVPQGAPLPAEDLDLLLECYRNVRSRDGVVAGISGSLQAVMTSSGVVYYSAAGMSVGPLGTVLRELRLAGRKDEAKKLFDDEITAAQTTGELGRAITLCIEEGEFQRLDDVFSRWQDAVRTDLSRPGPVTPQPGVPGIGGDLATILPVLQRWMTQLGTDGQNDKVLKVADQLLSLAIESSRVQRSRQAVRSPGARTSRRSYMPQIVVWRKNQQTATPPGIPLNEYLDQSMLQILRQTQAIFEENDLVSDLRRHIQQRQETATAEDRPSWQLLNADLLWTLGEHEQAMNLLDLVAQQVDADPDFRMNIARLNQGRGQFEEALRILDALTPRDQRLLQERELLALDVAQRLGDVDRARSAAERLFGLRLTPEVQMSLVPHMRRLGQHDLADAIHRRVQQRGSSQPGTMLTLMTQYQSEGKVELAQQLAQTILQRTTPAPSSSVRTSGFSNQDSGMRSTALQLLARTGGLQKLIDRIEDQRTRSPGSTQLIDQLVEFYGAANQPEKAKELVREALSHRPNDVGLRLQLARQLESGGKNKEACDEYLAIIESKPEAVSNNFWQVRSLFQREQREKELADLLGRTDLKRFSQPYYIIDIASNLLSKEETRNQGVDLVRRCFDSFPSYRPYVMSRIHDPNIWKIPEVLDLVLKALIPTTEAEVMTQPWSGLTQLTSYGSGGVANGILEQFLTASRGTAMMEKLREEIQKGVDKYPNWLGGRAILAILDIESGHPEQGTAKLQELFPNEESLQRTPSVTLWMIGQRLDQWEASRELGLKMLELAYFQNVSANSIEHTPGIRLVKVYRDLGQPERARELLLKSLKMDLPSNYDPGYAAYQRISQRLGIAQELLASNFAVDALMVYRDIVNQPGQMELASGVFSSSSMQIEQYRRQAQQGMEQALKGVQQGDAQQVVDRLLPASEELPQETTRAVLDLALLLPTDKTLATQTIQSALVNLLQTLAADEKARTQATERLKDLREKHPDDLSVATLSAMWDIWTVSDGTVPNLDALLQTVRSHPLEVLDAGQRANSRQRAVAAQSIPLWLVARHCLTQEGLVEVGQELGERALEGAARQLDKTTAIALLLEWGQLAVAQGRTSEAEQRWSEVLGLVTTVAKPRPKTASPVINLPLPPGAASRNGNVPVQAPSDATGHQPLTHSQFRMAAFLAESAAKNGMWNVSRNAVRTALQGGLPVADLPTADTSNQGAYSGVIFTRRPSQMGASSDGSDAILLDVAQALKRVMSHWEQNPELAEEACDLISEVVFPARQPGEIRVCPDSSRLTRGQVSSLGETLVIWSRRAGLLPELRKKISEGTYRGQAEAAAQMLTVYASLADDDLVAARGALEQLTQQVEAGSVPSIIELAAHAALRAFEQEELRPATLQILKRANQQFQTESEEFSRLSTMIARELAASGQTEEVGEFYESFLTSRQAYYARYSGDSGLYQQMQDWARIANEAAMLHLTDKSLDYMGRVTDLDLARYPRPSLKQAILCAARDLRSLPAQQRYEIWRDWTLPAADRNNVRVLADLLPPLEVPPAFQGLSTSAKDWEYFQGPEFVSNVALLLAAAEEAGTLDELYERTQQAVEQKSPHSEALWPLILLRRGDLEKARPLLKEYFSKRSERATSSSSRFPPPEWEEYLVWRECLETPGLSDFALEEYPVLLSFLRGRFQGTVFPLISRDVVRHMRSLAGENNKNGDPGLVHWFPASVRTVPAGAPMVWTATPHTLVHHGGSGGDMLFFRYPLSGNFEFSAELSEGLFAQSELGFNGTIIEALPWFNAQMRIISVSAHQTHNQAEGFERESPQRNVATIRCRDGRLQYVLNGYQLYEEPLSGTSPWLQFSVEGAQLGSIRALKFTELPTIPREVPLITEDQMAGWNCSFFGESQPVAQRQAVRSSGNLSTGASAFPSGTNQTSDGEAASKDWHVSAGELTGRRKLTPGARDGWIFYHRPLQTGETVRCQFFHVPGEVEVHPALGRFVFQLDPAGVRSRWLTQGAWEESVLGIPSTAIVDEAEYRRGAALPLRANEWNDLEMTLAETVSLRLNGELIFERPVDESSMRCFGLFHEAEREARVRRIVLTGPWPEQLNGDIADHLLATHQAVSPVDERIQALALGEAFDMGVLKDLLVSSHTLDDPQRFALLKEWVLPSATHDSFRLNCDRTPLGYSGDLSSKDDWSAGEVRCPAWELAEVAARLNRLDELSREVASAEAKTSRDFDRREALLTILDVVAGRNDSAKERLSHLADRLRKSVPEIAAIWEGAPEYVAVRMAATRPELQGPAGECALLLRDGSRKQPRAPLSWKRDLEELLLITSNRAAATSGPLTPEEVSQRQWRSVPHLSSYANGTGMLPARWRVRQGMATLEGGLSPARLYFQSPLRGAFEVTARATIAGDRAGGVFYGLQSLQVNDPEDPFVGLFRAFGNSERALDKLPVDSGANSVNVRIVSDRRIVTHFLNDTKVYESHLVNPDPWLILQSRQPWSMTDLSDVSITGRPEIPRELDLLAPADDAGWRADFYTERLATSADDTNSAWKRQGDEILGRLQSTRSAQWSEGLLQYHRPMLEDGEFEFQMYFVPEEMEAGPALGRIAYLMRPDGVQRHVLTDAQYELSDLTSDNLALLPDSRSVKLRERDWNTIRIALEGDRLTLYVNDEQVGTDQVADEPTFRTFGLFRFCDKTGCRVRQIRYRGQWPTELPEPKDQILRVP